MTNRLRGRLVAYTTPLPARRCQTAAFRSHNAKQWANCEAIINRRDPSRKKWGDNSMSLRTFGLAGLALVLTQLAACQKSAPFNPTLAGSFFPLRAGSRWTYQVTYEDGTRAMLSDHVEANPDRRLDGGAAVSSEYSGFDALVPADLRQAYRPEDTKIEIRYAFAAGYITRTEGLGAGTPSFQFEEQGFLPRYLRPDQVWSDTLSPAAFLRITQHHRSFREARVVVVPAGRFSDCIRIETEASYERPDRIGPERYFIDWYAPNVGLIKTVVLERGHFDWYVANLDWYLANSALIKRLLTKSGLFSEEIASVELLSFVQSTDEDARGGRSSTNGTKSQTGALQGDASPRPPG